MLRAFLSRQSNVNGLINELSTLNHDRSNTFIPNLAKGLEWQDFSINRNSLLIKDLSGNPQTVINRFFKFIVKYNDNVFSTVWGKDNIKNCYFRKSRYGRTQLIFMVFEVL